MLKVKVTSNVNTDKLRKKVLDDAMKVVDAAGLTMRFEAKANLERHKTNHTGALASSIKVLSKPQELKAKVTTGAPYAAGVEWGNKPGHYPDIDKLRDWVRLKLRVPAKHVDYVTGAVAYKIEQQGTKPQPYFTPAFEMARKQLKQQMKRMVDKL